MISTDPDSLGDEDVAGLKCPECKETTIFRSGVEVSCEDCGSHSAVECDECGERFDSIRQYETILKFNNIPIYYG